jgi:maleylacetoacetate isomerase
MATGVNVVQLHGYFRSSAAFRVRIALNLKGLEVSHKTHNLRKDEHLDSAYTQLNPQALVPALEIDGLVLTQSMAIIEYLEEAYPQPALLPADFGGRARVRSLAQMIACDIHPINNLRVLRYLRKPLGHDEATVQVWYNHWITEGFVALERRMAGDSNTGKFCHGDQPSMADICLVPQVINARNYALDMSPYPTIVQVFENAMSLAAFERALPVNQGDAV